MIYEKTQRMFVERYDCRHIPPGRPLPSLEDDVKSGLLQPPRSLPPKYFYDAHGSELFDRICETPEYYPTRTESELLRCCAANIIELCRPQYILELGSGSARKTRYLFDACEQQNRYPQYWPMDVCEPMLMDTGGQLTHEYPWLDVRALVGDYHAGMRHFPELPGAGLYVFLGGTIGNFEHCQAVALLRELAELMSGEDWLLLGFDRVKQAYVLNAAYNDAAGITAEFNLNLLRVLNRDVQADFDLDSFRHYAEYSQERQQIEMFLIAEREQTVQFGLLNETLYLHEKESILTEISRKFTCDGIEQLLAESGFEIQRHYQADQEYYSLVLARLCR